ncbi:hypothetical protein N9Y51_04125, partial [Alphaproteobacteria bacterium]|nr:hypothetical protein [Alphaproteobacteria bacterium]
MGGFYNGNPEDTVVGSTDATEGTINENAVTEADSTSSFYRGSPEQTTIDGYVADAAGHATAASTSASAALVSENNASDSEAAALASQSAASNSATTAQNLEITSASFDTTDGTLTLTKANSGTVTADLDGRFLTSETSHDDVLVDGDFASEGLMKRDATSGSYSIVTDNSGNWNTAYGWGNHADANYLTTHQDISGKANLSGASFTGNVNIGIPPTGTQSLLVAGATTLYGGVTGGLDVTGDITVSGTVDGVDIATLGANAIVDGDFTSNGLMKRDGAGVYSVDSSTYATETYVDTAVSNLVDSAPAALDTLNELASALGDDANFSTTVTNSLAGKANLSGATFTGNVNVQDGLLSANSGANQPFFKVSTVAASGSAGVFLDGDIVVNGTVDGVDIATRDAVLTSTTTTANSALQDLVDDTTPQLGGDLDLNGNDITGTGAINIGGGYNTSTGSYVTSSGNLTTNAGNIIANSGTLTLGSDATIGGNVVVTGTVDGRDVATDGARLDTIPYHRVRDDRLSSFNQQLALTTTNQNLGQYQNLYHPNTPVETMRFVDVEWTTLWSYVSSTNNDIRLSLYLTVPSTVSAVSIGTANAFAPSSYYSVRQSNEA